MSTQNLLVELFVEELPPRALKTLGESFAREIRQRLVDQFFVGPDEKWEWFATPRRLAVLIFNVADISKTQHKETKLLPVSIAYDSEGNPTAALIGKFRKENFDPSNPPELKRRFEGKTEFLFFPWEDKGFTLASALVDVLNETVARLPVPKMMSYQLDDGWRTVNFVRPAHTLVVLHGKKELHVPDFILGLKSGRVTKGHRFEAKVAKIELESADSYAQQLEEEGAVIASFNVRREQIVNQLHGAAAKAGLRLIEDDALLDEVTGLVERPNVLTCEFESEYLQVPQECLILTMKANQKYFPLLDAKNKLSNKFLVVSNIRPADPSRVIQGNERVVRARLADAKFFFDQDRKKPLLSHLESLGRVVYHNKLGTQLDRVNRIGVLAQVAFDQLLPNASATKQTVEEAAQLCKCDLLTQMVGEFPELQGTMGYYYASAEGKNAEIANAIREHYLPRGADDDLPATNTGIALALADKIDTIAGVFAINQKPTGAKDPFGVRRAAIGILRILIERKIEFDLLELIRSAVHAQPKQTAPGTEIQQPPMVLGVQPWYVVAANEIGDYIMERLRSYYLEDSKQLGITTEMFDAVLANRPVAPLDFDRRLHALHDFLKLEDAQSLAAANKRISNILRKSGQESFGVVNTELLRDPAEQVLHKQIVAMTNVTEPLFAARDYSQALTKLASLRASVDAFFDGVMVMADDVALRNNRLALLAQLRSLFLRVADLSRLPG